MADLTEYEIKWDALNVCIATKRPVHLIGDPGIGKTESAKWCSHVRKMGIYTCIASIREPTDFMGHPYRDGNATYYAPPKWALDLTENDILFFDEVTTCPPSVQAPLMRVVLEHVLGEHELPNIAIALASNDPDDIGGYALTLPMRNRMTHIEWIADDKYLQRKASNSFLGATRIRDGWKDRVSFYEAAIDGFLRRNPGLRNRKPKEGDADLAWPSSRTWSAATQLLAAAETLDRQVSDTLLVGTVGTGPAAEFRTYLTTADLPDPEDLIRDPSLFKPDPSRGDLQYVILQSVVGALGQNYSTDRFKQAWKIIDKAAKDYAIDIATVAARGIIQLSKQKGEKWVPDVQAFSRLAAEMRG